MHIRPVGAELFHADRWTDERTDRQDEGNSRLEYHVSHQERFRTKFRTEFVEYVAIIRHGVSQLERHLENHSMAGQSVEKVCFGGELHYGSQLRHFRVFS